jgi:hypothetical protein
MSRRSQIGNHCGDTECTINFADAGAKSPVGMPLTVLGYVGRRPLLAANTFFENMRLIAGFVLVALIAADRRVTSSRPLGHDPLKSPH